MSTLNMVGLTETHIPHETFGFPGWTVFSSPRCLRVAEGESRGGVALLLRGDALAGLVRHLGTDDGVPPETVAIELNGAMFRAERNVIIIVAYATRPGKIENLYKEKFGVPMLQLLDEFQEEHLC